MNLNMGADYGNYQSIVARLTSIQKAKGFSAQDQDFLRSIGFPHGTRKLILKDQVEALLEIYVPRAIKERLTS